MRVAFHQRAWAQPREGADQRAGSHRAAFEMAEGADFHIILDHHAGGEDHAGADQHVAPQLRVMREDHGFGLHQRRAARHGGVTQTALHLGLGLGQLGAAVDAAQLLLGRFHGFHPPALTRRQRHHIGEVVFALGVVVADRAQPAEQLRGRCGDHARIAQPDSPFSGRGIRPFDDARHAARRVGDDAAIAAGIGRAHRQQRQGRGIGGRAQAPQRCHRDQRVVGVEHGRAALEAFQGACRRQRRVPGAQALGLNDRLMRRGGSLERGHVGADHHHHAVEHLAHRFEQVLQHRPPRDGVQRLGLG